VAVKPDPLKSWFQFLMRPTRRKAGCLFENDGIATVAMTDLSASAGRREMS